MSQDRVSDPAINPEQAAHEVVLELIKANAISANPNNTPATQGKEVSDALKAAHQIFNSYYKGLSGK